MKLIYILPIVLFASCANLQTAQKATQAWSNTTDGKVILTSVKVAAQAFGQPYAGIIGRAIDSVQTGKIPAASVIADAIDAATGYDPENASKISTLVTAVIAAAQSTQNNPAIKSPIVGMNAASAAVNSI